MENYRFVLCFSVFLKITEVFKTMFINYFNTIQISTLKEIIIFNTKTLTNSYDNILKIVPFYVEKII